MANNFNIQDAANQVPKQTILVVGNSISQGGGLIDWPTILDTMQTPLGNNLIVNNSVSGESLATTIANYATRVGTYKPSVTGRPLLVVLPCAGGVDVYDGTSAADTWALIQGFADSVQADGGKLMVGTVAPGSFFVGAADTRRIALNALIAAGLADFDFYWPLDKIFRLTNQDYFGGDDQHLSQLGHQMMAHDFVAAVNGAYTAGHVAMGQLAVKELVSGPITDGFSWGGVRLEGHISTAKAHIGVSPYGGTGMLCMQLAPEGCVWFKNDLSAVMFTQLNTGYFGAKRYYFDQAAAAGPFVASGAGSPESVVAAPIGSLWLRTDGSTSTTLYVKTSGTGNTGWTAK